MPHITMISGKQIDLENPNPDCIDLRSLAYALARTCRFGGHTSVFYSVAAHSLAVASGVPEDLRLAALMHDAHEVLWGMGDIATPVKSIMPPEVLSWVRGYERRFQDALAARFGFSVVDAKCPVVKQADTDALESEMWRYMDGPKPDRVLLSSDGDSLSAWSRAVSAELEKRCVSVPLRH